MQNNTSLSVGDAGSLLMGAGFSKLDDIVVGVSLIGIGVLLKVLVAILNKEGVALSNKDQFNG